MIAIINAVAGLAGTWMEGKVETQKAKVEVAKRVAAGKQEWEATAMAASDGSWKDEAWTIFFIGLIAACMWPDAQPYIKQGFIVLKEDCPEFISWGILASIGASFGLKSIGAFKK
jgi:hypothetical protein|tara:strand:- start:327 stop:671 length:345 start_codon:yes stop_codon:yes gene_type:complete